MKETTVRLAMGQMVVEGGCPEANLTRAEEMIRRAADAGCDIVVLPECLDLGWGDPSARRLAQPIPGSHSDRVCTAASRAGLYVVAGIVERAGDRLYNSAVLISPQGEILLKHRKINELTIVQDLYATGDRLQVVETSLGTIGVNICADNFPSSLVLGHSLARMGAQMILSPCAWVVEADHDNERDPYGELWKESYFILATLYDIAVVGVSNVGWLTAGPWKGRKCIGCSFAVGPGGELIAEAPYGESAESLTIAMIHLRPRQVTGTAIAEMLAAKGYVGP
jgi:predicted amidohydrolase